jgi:SAM-dependent methyltransferase
VRPGHRVEIDVDTRGGQGREFITDQSFYSMFSDLTYSCLDVSSYEGAELVWDLCEPIPAAWEGRYDLILNGSCLDNLFDPATAMKNMSRLLKPGGRVIHFECSTRVHNAYLAYSYSWFHDYYALNDFEDCKVYMALTGMEGEDQSTWNHYIFDPIVSRNGQDEFIIQEPWYDPKWLSLAFVIAEKGRASTWGMNPVQFQYRSPHDRERNDAYMRSAIRFRKNPRPIQSFPGSVPLLNDPYHPCGPIHWVI